MGKEILFNLLCDFVILWWYFWGLILYKWTGNGPSTGALLAGGAAAAAALYGAHQLSHGAHHLGHGGYYGHGFGHHGKFKHGKFKHGKFGKRWKHGMFGKHKGGFFKRWKWMHASSGCFVCVAFLLVSGFLLLPPVYDYLGFCCDYHLFKFA